MGHRLVALAEQEQQLGGELLGLEGQKQGGVGDRLDELAHGASFLWTGPPL